MRWWIDKLVRFAFAVAITASVAVMLGVLAILQ